MANKHRFVDHMWGLPGELVGSWFDRDSGEKERFIEGEAVDRDGISFLFSDF